MGTIFFPSKRYINESDLGNLEFRHLIITTYSIYLKSSI
jgi:hypothetical protein